MTKKQQLVKHNSRYHRELTSPPKKRSRVTTVSSFLPEEDKDDSIYLSTNDSSNYSVQDDDLETVSPPNDRSVMDTVYNDTNVSFAESNGAASLNIVTADPGIATVTEPGSTADNLMAVGQIRMESKNPRSNIFFSKNMDGNGISYLVGLAHFSSGTFAGKIPQTDEDFYLRYAVLCKKIGAEDRHMLASLLHSYENIIQQRNAMETIPQFTIRYFPKDDFDIRKSFFKGSSALFPNFPIPKIYTTNDGHAYCLFSDALTHFFHFGGNVSAYIEGKAEYPQSHISHGSRAQKILRESKIRNAMNDNIPLATILICDWSDDFDPNYGSINKGSVFVKTISIMSDSNSSESSLLTFPLVLGDKNKDHSGVDAIIMDDLRELQENVTKQVFYSSFHKRYIRVDPCIITSLHDQPARRSYTCLTAGNGKFGARWGYAMDWSAVKDHLPMCLVCFTYTKKYVSGVDGGRWPIPGCRQCANWSYDVNHELLSHPPPKDYPLKDVVKLRPRKVSFDDLSQCIITTHKNLLNGSWSSTSATIYLKTLALSDKAIQDIITKADNCYQYGLAVESKDGESLFYKHIMDDYISNPLDYCVWKPPKTWQRHHGVGEFSNAIMHLVSGVVKTTVKCSFSWLSRRYDTNYFEKQAGKAIRMVNDLGLIWCRLPPYFSDKLVGSLSENNINLSRIISWSYSVVPTLKEQSPYIEPKIPQDRWLMKDNIGWLKTRGLCTTGSASEIRKRVESYMTYDPVPAPLSEYTGGRIVLMRLMHSLSTLCSIIFRKQYKSIEDTFMLEARVHLFLQHFHIIDAELQKRSDEHVVRGTHSKGQNVDSNNQKKSNLSKRKKATANRKSGTLPRWISSYNFLSLLNLGEEARALGPPRGHYEGSYRGEKIVSMIKPNINRGLYSNWSEHTMTNLWLDYTSKALLKRESLSTTEADDTMRNRGKMYIVYSSIAQVEYNIGKRIAISGCISMEQKIYHIAVSKDRTNKTCKLMEICLREPSLEYCGMKYHAVEIVYRPYDELMDLSTVSLDDYFVLLPLVDNAPVVSDEESKISYYTVITYEWSEKYIMPLLEPEIEEQSVDH